MHVGFLCDALGQNIQQHFQCPNEYGDKLEEVPWIKHVQGEDVDVTLTELHIFWVNSNDDESRGMNHIVPLLKVPQGVL